mmetsp:Transcript_15385/g.38592  ORF Transcript_15385/g.38592 Transcript_15385/m.38592 type:complete len:395 (+) Transcript_15385:319-1503(+)
MLYDNPSAHAGAEDVTRRSLLIPRGRCVERTATHASCGAHLAVVSWPTQALCRGFGLAGFGHVLICRLGGGARALPRVGRLTFQLLRLFDPRLLFGFDRARGVRRGISLSARELRLLLGALGYQLGRLCILTHAFARVGERVVVAVPTGHVWVVVSTRRVRITVTAPRVRGGGGRAAHIAVAPLRGGVRAVWICKATAAAVVGAVVVAPAVRAVRCAVAARVGTVVVTEAIPGAVRSTEAQTACTIGASVGTTVVVPISAAIAVPSPIAVASPRAVRASPSHGSSAVREPATARRVVVAVAPARGERAAIGSTERASVPAPASPVRGIWAVVIAVAVRASPPTASAEHATAAHRTARPHPVERVRHDRRAHGELHAAGIDHADGVVRPRGLEDT